MPIVARLCLCLSCMVSVMVGVTIALERKWVLYIVSLRYAYLHHPSPAVVNRKGLAQRFLV